MRACLLLLMWACAPEPAVDLRPDPGVGEAHAVAVMTTASNDYTVGALTTVPLDGGEAPQDVATIHSDAVLTVDHDLVWVVNRLLVDSVRRYAPGRWTAPEVEVSTGQGSNPQDVALCGEQLFVALYEEAHLLVLDPETGEEVGRVSLSDEADDDGVPEAASLEVLDDRLYVGLQRMHRLEGWAEDPEGRLVEVDCEALSVVRAMPTRPNPVLVPLPDAVGVVTAEGLARFDGVALSDPQPLGPSDARLVDVSVGPDGRGAFISRRGGVHVVGCMDEDGRATLLEERSQYVADVAINDRGQAWFALRQGWEDPSALGGLSVVDLAACVEVPDAVAAPTFPPFSIGFY